MSFSNTVATFLQLSSGIAWAFDGVAQPLGKCLLANFSTKLQQTGQGCWLTREPATAVLLRATLTKPSSPTWRQGQESLSFPLAAPGKCDGGHLAKTSSPQ